MKSEKRQKMKEDFKQFVDSASKAAGELGDEISRTAEKLMEEAKTIQRQLVVSVRLDEDSVRRVEQLLEAGVFRSRSEAVAFLTREGIRARQDLFRKIDEKIGEIHRIREELLTDIKNSAGPEK